MSRPLSYPIIACGYKVDLPYLLEFLNLGCSEDIIDHYAAIKLDWWFTDDLNLPYDQRDSYPEPVRYAYADHTWDRVMVMLRTRLKVLKTPEAVDERLLELDIDREKRDNCIKSIASVYKRDPLSFDLTHLEFDMKPYSPGPDLGESVKPQ